MYYNYLFGLTLLFLPFNLVYGQEPTTKVSDFNYGDAGENRILSVNSANGKIYANFIAIYREDDAGLISTIDPETGAATAVLDPDLTSRGGGQLPYDRPTVFEVGEQVFAVKSELSTGNNLYRIQNDEAILLHSAPRLLYSNFVALGDLVYFITVNKPVYTSGDDQGDLIAELWQTDGSPEGTQQVATLPAFFNRPMTEIVAGEQKLFIAMLAGPTATELLLYDYDPTEGQLAPITNGQEPLTFTSSRFYKHISPIAFYNGGFYVAGQFGEALSIYRIDEEDSSITTIDLPRSDRPNASLNPYLAADFVVMNERLYVLARADGDGPDLFGLSSDPELPAAPILRDNESENSGSRLAFSHTVHNDTLYFISRQGTSDVQLYGYAEGMGRPRSYYTLGRNQDNNVTINADDRYLYLTYIFANGTLTRLERSTGAVETTEYRPGFYSDNRIYAPLALLNGSAYFVSNEQISTGRSSLLRWKPDNSSPEGIDNYKGPIFPRVSSIVGGDAGDESLLIRGSSYTVYSVRNNTLSPYVLGADLDVRSGLYSWRTINGELYALSTNTDIKTRIYHLEGNTISELNFVGEGIEIDTNNYEASTPLGVSGGRMVIQYKADNSRPIVRVPVIGRADGGTITVSPLFPADAPDGLSFEEIDSFYFATYLDVEGNEELQEFTVNSYDGEELARFQAAKGSLVRGVTDDGFFLQTVERSTLTTQFHYYSFSAPGTPEILQPDGGTPAFSRDNFYVLNGKLIFTGDSPTTGREWYVAAPGSGVYTTLKDINPGPFGSGLYPIATKMGNYLYFSAKGPEAGREIWKTDGTTEGTTLLADINEGPGYSTPINLSVANGFLFFSAIGPKGYELYRYREGDDSPRLMTDINPGPGDSFINSYRIVGDKFCMIAREDEDSTYELFVMNLELATTNAELSLTPARAYPNPVGSYPLTVEAPANESVLRLELFGANGQLVRQAAASGSSAEVSFDGLPAGTYWLRTWYASGRFSINAVQRIK